MPAKSEGKESSNLLGDKLLSGSDTHGSTDPPPDDKPPAVEKQSVSCWQYLMNKRPYFVEIPIFLYFLAYKGALPLKEQFIYWTFYSFYTVGSSPGLSPALNVGKHNLTSTDLQVEVVAEEEAAQLLATLNLARNVPALFTTLLICSYTDVIGRRWGIMLPCIGGALKAIVCLAVCYQGGQHLKLLFLGEVLEGIGGSIMTAQSSAVAYVADVFPPEKRIFRFTMIQGLQFLGTAVSNLIMGYMIRGAGFAGSFWYTFAVYVLCFLWVLFLLPEYLDVNRQTQSFSVIDTLRHAVNVFRIYTDTKMRSLQRVIFLLMLVPVVVDNYIHLGRNDVDVLYMLAAPFYWTSVIIGYFQLTKYFLKFLVGFTVKCQAWCLRAQTIGAIGSVFGVTANLLMGLANTSLQLWIVAVLSAPDVMILPMAQSIMSKCVSNDSQGALFASLGVIEGLCDMFASTTLDLIYSASFTTFSGTVFLFMAGLFALTFVVFVIAWFLQRALERSQPPPT